jgi:probable HAF family extracellular repeat protein
MTTQRFFAIVGLGLVLAVPKPAKAQYNLIPIDVPGATSTAANGNSTHAIAGQYDDADGNTHGFVLSNGSFTRIDVPNAWFTTVNGVNANGDIVGIFRDDLSHPLRRHGFILSKGVFTTLDGPGSVRTSAFFINAKGSVVGTYRDAANMGHGFIWNQGVFTTLDVPDAVLTSATGINDHGDIVGIYTDADSNTHGFTLIDGLYTTLDAPGADGFTVGQGINDAGQIVGFYGDINGVDHGFSLIKSVYASIDVPGSHWTEVYSINAKREIVGAFEDPAGVTRGFVGTPVR